ncbi:MAG: HAMP domain-containing protein [Thermomicrobiales bacterium]|nr:HAMP domain-containing protein [Thermomicrobiales bacterium]
MIPIRWRLTLFHAVTTLIIALVLIGALFALVARTIDRDAEEAARARAFQAASIIESGRDLTAADLDELGEMGAYVITRDASGQVVNRTENASYDVRFDHDAVWREAIATGLVVEKGEALSWFAQGPTDFVIAVPIKRADSPVKVVIAGRSYGGPGRDLVSFASAAAIGGVALLLVLIAIGGSFLLAHAAMSPVNAIVASARQITGSDLSQRLPVKRKRDELGRLALAFNDLLARLEGAFRQREETLTQQRRFVADASHELRTPLTSIQGYARMLRQWALDDPATARESVDAIEREATRMTELVENLFRLAHGDEGAPLELANHDLREIVTAAVDDARAAQERVRIDYEPPAAPVVATFDRDRIRQVTTILLDNAVKYTPGGGRISVAIRNVGKGIELTVMDTGVGIPQEHIPHIFERFYRVDAVRSAGGTGLGLAIARQIVEQHHGTIEVTSSPGRGSTFTMKLPPGAPSPLAATDTPIKPRRWWHLRRRKITESVREMMAKESAAIADRSTKTGS